MRHVQKDTAHFRPSRIHDRHFFLGLQKIKRHDERVDDKAGDAAGITSFARAEGDVSGKYLVVGLFHLLLGPGLQNRVVQIGYAVSRLNSRPSCGAVVDIGIARIVGDRPWARRRGQQFITNLQPGRAVKGMKVRDVSARCAMSTNDRQKRRACAENPNGGAYKRMFRHRRSLCRRTRQKSGFSTEPLMFARRSLGVNGGGWILDKLHASRKGKIRAQLGLNETPTARSGSTRGARERRTLREAYS